MKVRVWIETNKVGSRCETVFDIEDEDFDGPATDDDIEECAKDVIWDMAEWGWEKLP